MAGEVLDLHAELHQDNLAVQLSALYSQWYVQLQGKHDEWRELRNYLFATDTTTTSNSTLPWKNKTTLPKLTQIRDNLHANYMDALFPNDGWLKWEGYNRQAVTATKREAIEAYMFNKLREGNYQEEISKLVYDYIDYGNAFAEAVWVKEGYKDPDNNEFITTYVGPKLKRISPFDHVFNPTAAQYKDSPKFTRYLKSIGELKKDILENPSLNYDDNAFHKAMNTRTMVRGLGTEDLSKMLALQLDGFGSLSEYYGSGQVEILEFEGDTYDESTDTLLTNRIITVIDRMYVLRNIPNPAWTGKDYKNHVGWRDRPDNLYAMGPLDNLVGLQYRLDHLENIKADGMDLAVNPPLVIKGEVEPFEWGPNVTIHVPEDGDVEMLTPNAAVFQVNNELAFLVGTMEEFAGAPKEAMGQRTPGEKTAFEVGQLANAASRIFQNKITKFEKAIIETSVNEMLELSVRNLDISDVVRVIDNDLGVTEFLTITKADITAKGILRPIGARHYASQAQLMQNLQAIFNTNIGVTIAPHVSGKELAKVIEEVMGFERFGIIKENIAVFEQAETQKLANQAGQDAEVSQNAPIDEEII